MFSLRSCRSSSVYFFLIFLQGNLENLVGNLEGILRGFFLTHRTKAQKIRGKFRSIFRSSKKIFRAKFTLQTCHLNILVHLGPPTVLWPFLRSTASSCDREQQKGVTTKEVFRWRNLSRVFRRTLYMGKAGTISQFFRALFPSTWRTLSPDALFTRIWDTRKHPESATFSCFPC